MTEIKHICFVVPNYPTKQDPMYTFVKVLVDEIEKHNIKCSVIAPQSITNFITKRWRKRPFFWQDHANERRSVYVYQPLTAHFLKFKIKGTTVSAYLTELACKRAFKKIKDMPDLIYSHFWHSGVISGDLAKRYKLPFFVATGESEIWVRNLYSKHKIEKSLENVNGVIAVSTKNKEESLKLGLTKSEKIKIIPNAFDPKQFYRKDKNKMRDKLGLNRDDFIIIFTGSFSDRKGVNRLSQSLDMFSNVKSIFIGKGDIEPTCKNILFKGRLPHDKINEYLNASDVFVLPTLAEGCSNAVIEAMACGLPIISSDKSFNDDILTQENSIRINSSNVEEIYRAIRYLKNNKSTCEEMAEKSYELAQELTIEKRTKRILSFLKNN